MDAFTDYYGDWLMEPLLRQPRPGGADTEWRARQPQDPAVRRALDVWSDPGATRAQREWAARVLLDAGVPGVWRGGLPAEAAEAPRLLPAGEPLDEAARQAAEAPRLLPAGEPASLDAAEAAAIPPSRALVPYDPEFAAIQSEFPWELRVKGRIPEAYRQMGMLTEQEYGAFLEARQRFPEVKVLGPEGPGQFIMRAPNDFALTGSLAATPAELYNRYRLTQLPPEAIRLLPEDIQWRVRADQRKVTGPAYGDIELHTRYRYYDPGCPEFGGFRPFRETEQALEFVRERTPSLRQKEIDWNYLRYWPLLPPGGIYFGEGSTYRIPAPWGSQLPW